MLLPAACGINTIQTTCNVAVTAHLTYFIRKLKEMEIVKNSFELRLSYHKDITNFHHYTDFIFPTWWKKLPKLCTWANARCCVRWTLENKLHCNMNQNTVIVLMLCLIYRSSYPGIHARKIKTVFSRYGLGAYVWTGCLSWQAVYHTLSIHMVFHWHGSKDDW